jgi:aminoglycoside phosphotransferase (APT) family kinase protein
MEAPVAEGARVAWQDVPEHVREAIQAACGVRVVEAATQRGGFSPGLAVRVRCADGTRYFVKAVSSTANPRTPAMHRQEAAILAALDTHIAFGRVPAPRLVHLVEEGTWVALLLTDVDGRHPALPWDHAQLAVVLQALDQMAEALTPATITAPTVGVKLASAFTGWRALAAAPTVDDLDSWSQEHLEALAGLETGWEQCAAGDTLLHTDLRADNLLLTDHGAVVVDWPGACTGAAFVDLVLFAPSVAMQGGPAPSDLLAASRTGRSINTELLRPLVCAVAGYFTERSLQPPPPGLPTVRAFQAAQGTVARRWLAELL